jgi:hypothetical protein
MGGGVATVAKSRPSIVGNVSHFPSLPRMRQDQPIRSRLLYDPGPTPNRSLSPAVASPGMVRAYNPNMRGHVRLARYVCSPMRSAGYIGASVASWRGKVRGICSLADDGASKPRNPVITLSVGETSLITLLYHEVTNAPLLQGRGASFPPNWSFAGLVVRGSTSRRRLIHSKDGDRLTCSEALGKPRVFI